MWRRRTHMLGRMNLSFWNSYRKKLRNMVIACGGRSEWHMDVARVQDRWIHPQKWRSTAHSGITSKVSDTPLCEADGVIELHIDDRHGVWEGNDCYRIALQENWDEVRLRNLVWQLWKFEIVEVRDGRNWQALKQETFPVSDEKVGDERLQGECFSKIGQGVHWWWQRGIKYVKVQILSAHSVASLQSTVQLLTSWKVRQHWRWDSWNNFWDMLRVRKTWQLCCVTAMTEENSWSNDWKSTQIGSSSSHRREHGNVHRQSVSTLVKEFGIENVDAINVGDLEFCGQGWTQNNETSEISESHRGNVVLQYVWSSARKVRLNRSGLGRPRSNVSQLEQFSETPALVRQHFSVTRATRIGSGTQSGSRTRIRRIVKAHHKNKRKRHCRKDGQSFNIYATSRLLAADQLRATGTVRHRRLVGCAQNQTMDERRWAIFPPLPGLPKKSGSYERFCKIFGKKVCIGSAQLVSGISLTKMRPRKWSRTDDQQMVRFFEQQVRCGREAPKRQVQGDDFDVGDCSEWEAWRGEKRGAVVANCVNDACQAAVLALAKHRWVFVAT